MGKTGAADGGGGGGVCYKAGRGWILGRHVLVHEMVGIFCDVYFFLITKGASVYVYSLSIYIHYYIFSINIYTCTQTCLSVCLCMHRRKM